MNRTTILLLLAMGLLAACNQLPMTRYEHEEFALEVGARVKTIDPEVAVGDLDPSVRYSPDGPGIQVTIDVRILSLTDNFYEIVGADLLFDSGVTLSPTIAEDTTQRSSGGGLNLGLGFGFGGLGDQDDDLAYNDDNTDDDRRNHANSGIGVIVPIGQGDKPNSTGVTSARMLFELELEFVPVIDENYQVRIVLLAAGEDLAPGLQEVMLPVTLADDPEEADRLRKASAVYLVVEQEYPLILGSPFLTTEEAESRVPFLSKMPLLGGLFGSNTADLPRRDLLIFLTPHIVPVEEE